MKTHTRFGIEVEDVTDFQESGNFYSQAGQDLFVLKVLGGKLNGTYVDIGCSQPREINNTLRLEESGWYGINLDIRAFEKHWAEHRKSTFIPCDATKCNYEELFNQYFKSKDIDYLSIDIDGLSTEILKKIPFDSYKFNVITIEHDAYSNGNIYRDEQRQILTHNGYKLLIADVMLQGNSFEDWWVSEDIFYKYNKLSNIESSEIEKNLYEKH